MAEHEGDQGSLARRHTNPATTAWELVMQDAVTQLERLQVPGGWLYRTITTTWPTADAFPNHEVDVTFVPDRRSYRSENEPRQSFGQRIRGDGTVLE